jgi:hypothetical protein
MDRNDSESENDDPFIGVMLKQRYILIKKFNSDGGFGALYLAKD